MWWIGLVAVILLIPIGGMAILSATARKPNGLGVQNGRLAPCAAAANCVSSQADDDAHRMDPIPFDGDPDEARARLKTLLALHPRTLVAEDTGDYLHAESASLLFRFVDDLEFVVDREAKVIHFRSAARVGRHDMNVNRKRMEKIRKGFLQ
jgi:uncharacterized protein (DUF1499 family)